MTDIRRNREVALKHITVKCVKCSQLLLFLLQIVFLIMHLIKVGERVVAK